MAITLTGHISTEILNAGIRR